MLDMGKNCHIIKGVSNNETKVWFMYSSKKSGEQAHPPTKKSLFSPKIRYLVLHFGTPKSRPIFSIQEFRCFDSGQSCPHLLFKAKKD